MMKKKKKSSRVFEGESFTMATSYSYSLKKKSEWGDRGKSDYVQLFAMLCESFRQQMKQMPGTTFNSNNLLPMS